MMKREAMLLVNGKMQLDDFALVGLAEYMERGWVGVDVGAGGPGAERTPPEYKWMKLEAVDSDGKVCRIEGAVRVERDRCLQALPDAGERNESHGSE